MYKREDNSIELWATEAEKLFANNYKPMDDELVPAFLACFMQEKKMEEDAELKTKLEEKKLGLSSVFYNRVKYCQSYNVTSAVCLFVGMASKSFGEITIYTNYLQYKAYKEGVKLVDMNFISTKVFPWGFPTDEVLHKVWDMQKVKREEQFESDNLLDYAKCQKSITF